MTDCEVWEVAAMLGANEPGAAPVEEPWDEIGSLAEGFDPNLLQGGGAPTSED